MANKALFTKEEVEKLVEDFKKENFYKPLSWSNCVVMSLSEGFRYLSRRLANAQNSIHTDKSMSSFIAVCKFEQGVFLNCKKSEDYVVSITNYQDDGNYNRLLKTINGDSSIYIQKDINVEPPIQLTGEMMNVTKFTMTDKFDVVAFIQGYLNRVKNLNIDYKNEESLLKEHYLTMSTYHGLSIGSIDFQIELGNETIGNMVEFKHPMYQTRYLGTSPLHSFKLLSTILESIVSSYCVPNTVFSNSENYDVIDIDYRVSQERLLDTLISCRDNMSMFITTKLIPEIIKKAE